MIPAVRRLPERLGRQRHLGGLAALLAASLSAAPVSAEDGAAWRQAATWDDGRAEMCAYEVDWARYGRLYPGRALLVLVKEPWAPDLEVKADTPRPEGFDVLKLNHLRDVATGIYTYHQMASVFLRRDDGSVRKVAASSAEACGLTSARMVDGTLAVDSYFDGVGSWDAPWPAGALPEDGLPALLRDLVAGPLPERLPVYPSLLDGRLPPREPRRLAVERRHASTTETPWGPVAAVDLLLRDAGGEELYRFEAAPPHRLLALERSDGTTYRVARCDRLAYWEMHDPVDAEWWPEGLREPSRGR